MQLLFEMVVLGFLAPCMAGACAGLALNRGTKVSRCAAAMALLAAFATGTALLVWLPIVPQSHWQWLPPVVLLACVLGPLAELAPQRRWLARLCAASATALFAANVLVPDWSKLAETRSVLALGLGVTVVLLSLATTVGVTRSSATFSASVLMVCALAASLLMFLADSAKFAQVGGLLVAGCLSWIIVSRFEACHRVPLEGAAIAYVSGMCGLLLCGYLNSYSDVHWLCYVLVALAPLGLLLVGQPPIEVAEVVLSAKKNPSRRPWAAIAATSIPLIVALGWAISASLIGEQEW